MSGLIKRLKLAAHVDCGGHRFVNMKAVRRSLLVPIVLVLGGTACGEITAFCLSAGAPDGVTMEMTVTPTPHGNRITCGPVPPDSSQH